MKRYGWAVLWAALPSAAWAGGFEFPDNGTEALARGGAFTAKADSPLALEYNIAGLARQRGTRVLIDGNLSFHSYEFTRAGVYPGSTQDPATPFAGQPFPKVANQGAPFYAPFFGLATDFNYFDRWTFALGVFGPSSIGKRSFPAALPDGRPGPQRYDLVSEDLLIAYPTLAAAVRATRWLDIGLALHVAVASYDLVNMAILDEGAACKSAEYPSCDARDELKLIGVTVAGSLGILATPIPQLAIGLNVRSPIYLDATGTVDTPGSKLLPTPGNSGHGAVSSFKSTLPWVVRLGVRWIFRGQDGFEHGDIEADGVYEAWSMAQDPGIPVALDIVTTGKTLIAHRYRDTVGARLGGAYNLRLPTGVLSFRGGGFFDSSASRAADTRLDFDGLAKWAGTVGIGYSVRGVILNLAYAYIWSPDRNVTNGALQPTNGLDGTTNDANGAPFAPVNNGFYHAATQVLSFGVQLVFDDMLRKHRVHHYP